MGYLETGMRVLMQLPLYYQDYKNLQFLVQMTQIRVQIMHCYRLEAEALGDEFHRLMSTSKYKGKEFL
jgi:hypothetical protein